MKTAILVISFGTSHRDTLEKTIGAVEKKLKYEFKTDVFRAFTSGMIIKKLRERDGIEIDTVDEALEKLYKSGYTDIFCVPTHIMCGIEYDKACRMIEKFNDKMKIRISRPLVTETSDYYNIVDIFKHRLTDKNRLYIFMGHGSDHFANAAYPALDYHFKNADMNNVFVGTVEGFPDLETVMSHATKTDIKNVTLLPFMLVCGDHAKNDMAVEWKEEFENNIIKILLPKISIKEIKEQLEKVEKINKKGDGQMYGLAVCDMLARENKKIEKRGIIIGKKQGEKRGLRNGIIQVATNMLKAKMDSSTIKNVTGLTDKELKKLEGELLKKVDV